MERLKLSLCALIGVLLTVLAAAAVFPIRARTRLRKRTAKLLERMGNLAFYLLGEFCEVRRPLRAWQRPTHCRITRAVKASADLHRYRHMLEQP